ncbi:MULTISPECIES: class I SAM-dependent methyltransferase [Actinomadura]|uniref:Class I SAM-dependent methyltransferase n=1 Tax=Actinomadura yumaensis TaxID=111807 RepID=A0ABW2CFV1_9ACTN|nr:class I SAM-dependent methyltransferase [Actinomadura sp. J1-007]
MILTNITRRYTRIDSWFYDRFIADAVLAGTASLVEDIVAAVPAGGSVLEVGSGGGQFAVRLAEAAPALRITGVDLSREQVSRAAQRARHQPNVSFQAGSALDLSFPADRFDAAVSIGSIKHWPDQAKGVAEMLRVLRPGGLLLVVEVDRGCTLRDARSFVARFRTPRPLRAPALMGFRTYIAGQGLDLDDARKLVAPLAFTDSRVERTPADPMLLISGTKAGSS